MRNKIRLLNSKSTSMGYRMKAAMRLKNIFLLDTALVEKFRDYKALMITSSV